MDQSSKAQDSGETEFGPFVASKSRFHFHRPNCKWMENVNSSRLLRIGNHKEAVEAALRPCKTCCA
jgi:hypothetical protein